MRLLTPCLIFFTIIMTIMVLSQESKDIKDEFDRDEMKCSHMSHYLSASGQKSIINPNPHVFDYDVKFYKLDLEASNLTNQFSGNAVITGEVIIPQMEIFSIELSNKLQVDSAFIDGVNHAYTHVSNNITINLPVPLPDGSLFNFKLYYHTPPNYSSAYYSSTVNPTYGNFNVSQTLSEPYFAHEFMPCKQELDDKSDSVHVFITTDSSLSVAGPGLLTRVVLPGGKVRHEWRTNQKTAFYLIFWAVSDYKEYLIYANPANFPGDSIMIQNFVFDYPGCLESNKAAIDNTDKMIELLSGLYSVYPFHEEKYGHYMWYPSSFSGMEHITMSGMRYLNTYLISHELGHSWFGDNVTCASWSDIWINEGFATYTEYLVNQYLFSQASADAIMLSYMNYVMTSPGGSVYIPLNETNNSGRIFSTRLTYRKGGALVHMIRYEMNNDSLFFQTLKNFQQIYQDSLATGLDFKAVCEDVSGIDFTDFFYQWYFGQGYPIFSAVWSQHKDTLFLRSIQTTSTTITALFKMPVEFKFSYSGGNQIIRFYQLTNDTTFKIVIPHEVTGITIDPNNWILNQTGTITHLKNLELKTYLEGPFNGVTMNTILTGLPDFPVTQPYSIAPWNYGGSENLTTIPGSVVDWVLVELRDAASASSASTASQIARRAGLLHNDGTITSTDGMTLLQFDNALTQNLFVVIHHRNHLSIMSTFALEYDKGVYQYDFSIAGQIYQSETGGKELGTDIWGMIAGDADGNGTIEQEDKALSWEIGAGLQGYLPQDLNLDTQADNLDKDDFWRTNSGKTTAVPD